MRDTVNRLGIVYIFSRIASGFFAISGGVMVGFVGGGLGGPLELVERCKSKGVFQSVHGTEVRCTDVPSREWLEGFSRIQGLDTRVDNLESIGT